MLTHNVSYQFQSWTYRLILPVTRSIVGYKVEESDALLVSVSVNFSNKANERRNSYTTTLRTGLISKPESSGKRRLS